MPKFLHARPPTGPDEERTIRTPAGARHAPADRIRRAKMIVLSRQGLHTPTIADQPGCPPQTVRERPTRFNAAGLDGPGDRPIPGRPRRPSAAERSQLLALARSDPPGRPVGRPSGTLTAAQEGGPPVWSLEALTAVAHDRGIAVGRGQIRRILRAERGRWRRTHSWATGTDAACAGKGRK